MKTRRYFMPKLNQIPMAAGTWLLFGCSSPDESMIAKVLENYPSEVIASVLAEPDKFRVQILYTQISRDENNQPTLTTHSFRHRPEEYFYPASTVKLPIALLALEELNRLDIAGLDRHTPMLTDSAYHGQTKVLIDSTSENGLPSVDHYIKKVFLVSDNDAFNRLYEFLGQDEINRRLKAKGYQGVRILHRLSLPATAAENAATNPIRFVQDDQLVCTKPLQVSQADYTAKSQIKLGKGEIIESKLIPGAKEFRTKNQIGLKDLHQTLTRIVFPDLWKPEQRFRLSMSDRQATLQYMSQYPTESQFPSYDSLEFYDSFVKFFLFGDSKDPIPVNFRIFNKVGLAYGFVIDNAYVVDFQSKIEFFLTAVIYVNENQIFNDDTYEYEETGKRFLAEIGRAFYRYELVRKRHFLPRLDDLILEYQ